eukprot:m.150933 g.150933  ORF g.150933 m.150933 type:complete len:209 (+) comp16326_c0_seq3:17-643(+)
MEDDRSYYHGRISREEAVKRLLEGGMDGSFLLRMSTTQDGVYTLSVMQGVAVRHIRVVNTQDGGYALSNDDAGSESVWDLVQQQMHNTLTSTYNSNDQIALRYPLETDEASAPIAPDLLMSAGEVGIDASDFGDDVAAFLEGGVNAKALARRRSVKNPGRAAPPAPQVPASVGEGDPFAGEGDPFAGLDLPEDFDPDNIPEGWLPDDM